MVVFERMRALRAFENQHLVFLKTDGRRQLIAEIGHHQAIGKPLTLKQLFLLDIGSIATIQRHLRRLRKLGLVQHRRAASDRRAVELVLTPRCVRLYAKYDTLMTVPAIAKGTALESAEPRHVCGFCDSDAGRRQLLVAFFSQGLERGDKCVLVAPATLQGEIVDGMRHRRRASEQLILSEGHESIDAQLAFYRRLARDARLAGRNLCVAGDMSWAKSRNVRIEAIMAYEKRLDVLARKLSLRILCVYDARGYSSGEFLQAVKCHRDHARHPIMLA